MLTPVVHITEDVQLERIEGWAQSRGATIAKVHTDRDRSGGSLSAPVSRRSWAASAAGRPGDGVAKLDRLSRAGVGDALKLVQEISDAGAQLVDVDSGLDPTTEYGEFGMTILLGLARMERRRLSASWETAKGRAIERGVKISRAPIGYLANGDGRLERDPKTAPAMRELFERAAAGETLPALARWLETLDLRNPHKHPRTGKTGERYTWTTTTVGRVLEHRVYLGEASYGEHVHPGAHEPLTDPLTFARAQPAKSSERCARRRRPSR